MMQIYGYLAQDIARERQREAAARTLARLAAELNADERRAHPSFRRDGRSTGRSAAPLRVPCGA